MRFVDEKGKLFGIINLIDFAVITIIIASIITGYIGYKNMMKGEYEYTRPLMIKVLYTGVPVAIARAAKVGDSERGIIKIIDINKANIKPFVEREKIVATLEKDYEVLVKYQIITKMVITFKVVAFGKRGEYYIGDQVIKIGHGFNFTGQTYDLNGGTVIEIEEENA